MVRLPREARTDATRIAALPVGLANGQSVPPGDVADSSVADDASQMLRDRLRRRVDVDINLDGRDATSYVADAQKAVGEQVKLPDGYTLVWSGKYQHLKSAFERVGVMAPVVLGLIHFGSLKLATLLVLPSLYPVLDALHWPSKWRRKGSAAADEDAEREHDRAA